MRSCRAILLGITEMSVSCISLQIACCFSAGESKSRGKSLVFLERKRTAKIPRGFRIFTISWCRCFLSSSLLDNNVLGLCRIITGVYTFHRFHPWRLCHTFYLCMYNVIRKRRNFLGRVVKWQRYIFAISLSISLSYPMEM